jgi:hypothetical protein
MTTETTTEASETSRLVTVRMIWRGCFIWPMMSSIWWAT